MNFRNFFVAAGLFAIAAVANGWAYYYQPSFVSAFFTGVCGLGLLSVVGFIFLLRKADVAADEADDSTPLCLAITNQMLIELCKREVGAVLITTKRHPRPISSDHCQGCVETNLARPFAFELVEQSLLQMTDSDWSSNNEGGE